MSLGTIAFNDVSGTGYKASSLGPGKAVDIMMLDIHSPPSPDSNFYQDEGYTNIITDPIQNNADSYGLSNGSVTPGLIANNEREGSLMSTIQPEKTKAGAYDAPDVKRGDYARDLKQPITDGQSMAEKHTAQRGMQEDGIANFKADWIQARREAEGALEQVSKDMGFDPAAVRGLLVNTGGSEKSDAAAVIGAGSLAIPASGATYVAVELSKEARKSNLTEEDQISLLKETMKSLQSSGPQDTRVSAAASGGGAEAAPPADGDGPQWQNMEIDDLAEFLAADPEGEDQEEMLALRDAEKDLDIAEGWFEQYKEQYADVVTADKMYVTAAAGSSLMTDVIESAEVITAAPKVDVGDMILAGKSVEGISELKVEQVSEVDTSSLATKLNIQDVDMASARQALEGNIKAQFAAGGM